MTTEAQEEKKYCEWLSENNFGIALKLVLFTGVGWPDRTVLLRGGKLLFIEFKVGKNKLSGQQLYWRRIILNLGFKYFVCYSTKEAKKVTRLAQLSKKPN